MGDTRTKETFTELVQRLHPGSRAEVYLFKSWFVCIGVEADGRRFTEFYEGQDKRPSLVMPQMLQPESAANTILALELKRAEGYADGKLQRSRELGLYCRGARA